MEETRNVEETHIGVIDSLSAGLNLITERAWIIVVPVLLDIWYWLGPRLSISPLLRRIEELLIRSAPAAMPEAPVDIDVVNNMIDVIGQQFNLFSLLSASLMGVPTLMAGASSNDAGVLEISGWMALIGAATFLILVGLAIGCLYFTLIVRELVEEPGDHLPLLRQAGVMWLRIVALVLLVLFLGVALFVPYSFLIGLLSLIAGGVASVLMSLFYVGVIWAAVYLFFTVDAIALNDVGPIRAIWNSANIVARNFWSAFGLIALIFILSQGLSLIWQRLGEVHPVGMIIGIAGHAFIGSGLVAAGLLFYRDRYQHWKQQVA